MKSNQNGLPRKSKLVRSTIFHISLFLCVSLFSVFIVSSCIAENVFKVGVSVPLSGPFTEYGVAVKNGIEMARQDHPQLFTNVDFLFDDNRYDPKLAVSSVGKFIDINRIDLLFMWGNEPVLAVVPIVELRKMPSMVVGQDPRMSEGKEFVIRFINPAEDYAKLTLKHLRKRGFKHFGMLKAELSFCDMMVTAFRKNLLPEETFEIVSTILVSENDLKQSVLRAKSSKAEIIGLYLSPAQIVSFYREALSLRFEKPTFGTTSFESDLVLHNYIESMHGSFYVHGFVDENFRQKYIKKYKGEAEISYAANAYEFARLVGDTFNTLSRPKDGKGVINALKQANERKGIQGSFHFKQSARGDSYFEFPLALKIIQNGEIVFKPD